jgi:hypothetical protein
MVSFGKTRLGGGPRLAPNIGAIPPRRKGRPGLASMRRRHFTAD